MGKYVDENGDVLSRFISPGQGASAFYPEAVLERDSAEAFGEAHVFMDHPTIAEANARPERSVRDLVGGVVSKPSFLKEGPEGPGTYAKWHCFKPFRELVEEMAPFIGMSIRVPGEKESQIVEGKRTTVATRLIGTPFNSVDLVTRGARGGKMIAQEGARPDWSSPWAEEWLLESDRHDPKDVEAFAKWMLEREKRDQHAKEREAMDLQEAVKKIEALEATAKTKDEEIRRLTEALALRDAKVVVEALVNAESVKLPTVTKARLVEALTTKAPVKEGKLDEPTLRTMVAEAITKESTYVGGILKESGAGSRVRGMGDSGSNELDPYREELLETYLAEGMKPDEAAAKADRVANGGR